MSEITVKVRLGPNYLYDLTVYVDLKETVYSLKKAICQSCRDSNKCMNKKLMVIMYCGNFLEDDIGLSTYELFDGATVHVYQKIKPEKKLVPDQFDDTVVNKLVRAFRSLLLNSAYRNSLSRLCRLEAINILLLNNPNMIADPVAITLFQHPELLMKITDPDTIKRLSQNHPALAAIMLHVTGPAQREMLQNNTSGDINRAMLNNGSDDDEDLDDSTASEANGQPFSRNVVLGEITAAQLASALASARTQQSQPSTSSASTSTGNTGNLEALNNVPSQPTTTELILPTQLQIMRDMGLTNEAVNIAALRVSNDLETAIDLVLSGFTNT